MKLTIPPQFMISTQVVRRRTRQNRTSFVSAICIAAWPILAEAGFTTAETASEPSWVNNTLTIDDASSSFVAIGPRWRKVVDAHAIGGSRQSVSFSELSEEHSATWTFAVPVTGDYDLHLSSTGESEGLHLPFSVEGRDTSYSGVLSGRRAGEQSVGSHWRHLGTFTLCSGEAVLVRTVAGKKLGSPPDGVNPLFWGTATGADALRITRRNRAFVGSDRASGVTVSKDALLALFGGGSANTTAGDKRRVDVFVRFPVDASSDPSKSTEIKVTSGQESFAANLSPAWSRAVWIHLGHVAVAEDLVVEVRRSGADILSPFRIKVSPRANPEPDRWIDEPTGVGLNVRDLIFPEGPGYYGCSTMEDLFARFAGAGFTFRFWTQDITERLWLLKDFPLPAEGSADLPYNPLYIQRLHDAFYLAQKYKVHLVPVLWDDYFADPYLWILDPYNRANGGPIENRLDFNRMANRGATEQMDELLLAIATSLQGRSHLYAFDLGNDFSGDNAWLRWACGSLRKKLPGVPLTFQYSTGIETPAEVASLIDLVSVRAYPYENGNDAIKMARVLKARILRAHLLGRPVYVGEFGFLKGYPEYSSSIDITRAGVWTAVSCGARAVWKWSCGYAEAPAPSDAENEMLLKVSRALYHVGYARTIWSPTSRFDEDFGEENVLGACKSEAGAYLVAIAVTADAQLGPIVSTLRSLADEFKVSVFRESEESFVPFPEKAIDFATGSPIVVMHLQPLRKP